jgi:uncharacterized protein YbbC (DUF1343 family)
MAWLGFKYKEICLLEGIWLSVGQGSTLPFKFRTIGPTNNCQVSTIPG